MAKNKEENVKVKIGSVVLDKDEMKVKKELEKNIKIQVPEKKQEKSAKTTTKRTTKKTKEQEIGE